MRTALLVLLCAAPVSAQDKPSIAVAFEGELVHVRGREVTVHYDFTARAQLEDFVEVRPKGLFKEGELRPRIEADAGRLFLAGTGALVHRMAGDGLVHARFRARLRFLRDLGMICAPVDGEGEAYVLFDLFDHRFKDDGGFLAAVCRPGPPSEPTEWREILAAKPGDVEKRFAHEGFTEVEVRRRGAEEFCRIGNLYRTRPSVGDARTLQRSRFGWWVQDAELEIEELTLTLRVPDEAAARYALEFPGDAAVREERDGKLMRMIRDAPLSAGAGAARRELSRRGEAGWKKLHSLCREFARKQPYAALPLVAALANGPEDGRRALLRKLYPKRGPPDLQLAILRALAQWYPTDVDLLVQGLAIDLPGRAEYFRDLVDRGLPDDRLRALADQGVFPEDVFEILRDRGVRVEASGHLYELRATEAHSPVAARATLKDFAENPDWKLVDALLGFLQGDDKHLAKGAHLLLMTLSGKDIPPDVDLWRSWITARRGRYEPPPLSAPGLATAAIERGVKFLRADLLEDGACVWPTNTEWPACRVGATALAVYALRSSGVPADDPAIVKALKKTLLVVGAGGGAALRGDLERYTYALTLLALGLRSVDPVRFKPQLAVIANRIVAGQLENGQWTYYCKGEEYERRPKAGDNSNTQYAILALRACRRSGVEVPEEVWVRNQRFWHKSMNRNGGWGYGPTGTSLHEFSMTTAGVATLAICIEALSGVEATRRVKADKQIGSGMRRIGQLLFEKGYAGEEYYAFYGVERAAILSGIKAFRRKSDGRIFDWYAAGAEILVRKQKENGAWGDPEVRGVTTGRGYGEAIDTAYALLFLKRAVTGLAGSDGAGVIEVDTRRATRR